MMDKNTINAGSTLVRKVRRATGGTLSKVRGPNDREIALRLRADAAAHVWFGPDR
jgi:hypothetical protein